MLESNMSGLATSVTNIHAGSTHNHVEVHSIDTNIDVLLDTESKVSVLGEVLPSQLVLLDLESSLEDLLSLGSSHGAVNGDLLISSDSKASDSVSGLGEDGGLSCKRLQPLSSPGQSVTRLSNTNVETKFSDTKVTHHILGLIFTFWHFGSLVEVIQAI